MVTARAVGWWLIVTPQIPQKFIIGIWYIKLKKKKRYLGYLISPRFKNHLQSPQNHTTVCENYILSPNNFANGSLHYAGQEQYRITQHDSRNLRG